jgi:hypothetical protein
MIRHKCPVCGDTIILDKCNICETCAWEQDTLQEAEPNYRGGANTESLNEYRAWWNAQQKAEAMPA